MLNIHFRFSSARQCLPWLLIALLSGWSGAENVNAAESLKSSPTWKRAEYTAHKFFVTARVNVELSREPAAAVNPILIPIPGRVALPAAGDEVIVSQITNNFMSQETTLKLWARSDMQVLQRTSFYTGRKYWFRLFRYAEDGMYSLKRRPLEGEQEKEPSQWSEVNEDYYPHGPAAKSQILMEPELLFYYLAVTPMSVSSPGFDFIMVERGMPMRVNVSVAGTRQIDQHYVAASPQGEKHHEGSFDALRLRMQVTPLTKGDDSGKVQFLGLDGEIEMLLDPQHRIILELRGEAEKVGEVRFMLRRVDMH